MIYSIVEVHPYKNILLTDYMMPQKNFVQVMPKVHENATNCAMQNTIKSCNSLKSFGGFILGMVCSCAPMFKFFSVPPDGDVTEYKISNC